MLLVLDETILPGACCEFLLGWAILQRIFGASLESEAMSVRIELQGDGRNRGSECLTFCVRE